jgi:hypothetical protein
LYVFLDYDVPRGPNPEAMGYDIIAWLGKMRWMSSLDES